VEAIRLKAARLAMIRSGKVIARAPERVVVLDLPGRPVALRFERPSGS
jgi:cytosine deaminase